MAAKAALWNSAPLFVSSSCRFNIFAFESRKLPQSAERSKSSHVVRERRRAKESTIAPGVAVGVDRGLQVRKTFLRPLVEASKLLFPATVLAEVTAREPAPGVHREPRAQPAVGVEHLDDHVDVDLRRGRHDDDRVALA